MEHEDLLKTIARILQGLEIPYFVTGSTALAVWGIPRATVDIDIVVQLESKNLDKLASELLKIDKYVYVDKTAMQDALEKKGEFNFIHSESGLKVDFWVLKDDKFSKEQLKRRIPKKVEDQEIYFASPEDTILNKLLWYKAGGSARQLEDVESILIFRKDLDFGYIEKWAKILSITQILKNLKQKL